jgi:GT2 family glycosyltransferase
MAGRRGAVSDRLPPEVQALLDRRTAARQARNWATADALREQLAELGWEPIDSPTGSIARPRLAASPSPELASLLDEPATLPASLVVIAEDHPEDLSRFLDGLRAHPPAVGRELLVVANAPSFDLEAVRRSASVDAALLPSGKRLGWADAANLGLRRGRGAVLVLLDTSLEPTGDWLTPLLEAFDDPSVGIAGPYGVTSVDGREFDEAPPGEVDAVEAYCLAIRREALRAVGGGFDHRFRFYRNADLDLSFGVRAAGWRAIRTAPLPFTRHEHRGYTSMPPEERDRLSRRNFYRFLKHWGDRRDLLLHPGPRPERRRA